MKSRSKTKPGPDAGARSINWIADRCGWDRRTIKRRLTLHGIEPVAKIGVSELFRLEDVRAVMVDAEKDSDSSKSATAQTNSGALVFRGLLLFIETVGNTLAEDLADESMTDDAPALRGLSEEDRAKLARALWAYMLLELVAMKEAGGFGEIDTAFTIRTPKPILEAASAQGHPLPGEIVYHHGPEEPIGDILRASAFAAQTQP